MRKLFDTLGGVWVMFCLLVRCKGKTGSGSYLRWRQETAFGKRGQFQVSRSEQRRSVWLWAKWAKKLQRKKAH